MGSLTAEQARAIDTRDTSVALRAGAGCGKTFVLTERFLSHVDPTEANPAELSEVLAITFTERAAREMRERIRRFCYERVRSAAVDQVAAWTELLRQLDTARVTTIHAFCAGLLRRHAIEAGLDPQFIVLEQTQSDLIMHELIDDALRENLARRDEMTISLMAMFGLVPLRDKLRRMADAVRGKDASDWLTESPEQLAATWHDYAHDTAWPILLRNLSTSADVLRLVELVETSAPTNDDMRERVATIMRIRQLVDEPDAHVALGEIREAAKASGGAGKKHWEDADDYEAYRETATKVRGAIDKTLKYMVFDKSAAVEEAAVALQILNKAAQIVAAYDTRKAELGALDFDDLVLGASRLLADPANKSLRQRVANQFSMVLVDEFQDTDRVQVELVKALCGDDVKGGKLFFVGDFKQSIYRFRGAEPDVFDELQSEIANSGHMGLTLNFRSQPAVLDMVNALFVDRFGSAYEPLRAFRPAANEDAACIEFLWAEDDGSPRSAGAKQRARKQEADWIARRIRQMLDEEETLVVDEHTGEPRAVRQGDITILFRALSDVQSYEEALSKRGIDYYLVGGHAFYAQQEIFDLVNLFRVLTSTCDDVALAGVLRSPMFSLKDETLFWLSHGKDHDGLTRGLFAESMPSELDDEQRERVRFAASTISHLRRMKDRVSIAELLREVLRRTAYDAILLGEYLGERKLANVHKILEQARVMDRAGLFTLADFVEQLSEFVATQPREALAATQPEASDVVRLMTIHQAKGLEFPVVIVPDLDRLPHAASSGVDFRNDLGPLVRLPATERQGAVGGYDLYRASQNEEERRESDRLFYVATTRAADYLVLSSAAFNLDNPSGPWLKMLAARFDLTSGQLIGDVPPNYVAPMIRVTRAAPAIRTPAEKVARRAPVAEALDALRIAGPGDAADVAHTTRPIAPDSEGRVEYSFSRLSGSLARGDEPIVDQASRGPTTRDDAAQLGTLVHGVLANVDYRKAVDVSRLVERESARQAIDRETILDEARQLCSLLLASPLAERLATARQITTEVEFLLRWPPGVSDESSRIIRGFIDCLYEDPHETWHVLDYKTNRTTASNVSSVAAPYELQMHVYALAVEESLGVTPASLELYFLRPEISSVVDWNDSARKHTIDAVNEAIRMDIQTP